jgi:hypothetical protein
MARRDRGLYAVPELDVGGALAGRRDLGAGVDLARLALPDTVQGVVTAVQRSRSDRGGAIAAGRRGGSTTAERYPGVGTAQKPLMQMFMSSQQSAATSHFSDSCEH